MVTFPNCKINLGLQILNKRADGYHNLETVFYPLALQDGLEIIHHTESEKTDITVTGIDTNEDVLQNNICIKAYNLLKQEFDLPPVKIHLHKTIPVGAGLGGGSADGAFMLILLNKKFGLNISQNKLIEYALQLGSDCPFFIINKPCLAKGRGEELEEISLDLSAYKIIIVNPRIHINTSWAFSQLQFNKHNVSLKDIVLQPVTSWKNVLQNDFETPIFNAHNEIKNCRDELYHQGAIYAAMSGSGSTVFGLFEKNAVPQLSFPSQYLVKEC